LRLGDNTFLMVRENESDDGGTLIRYVIEGDEFVTYRLNESRREDFIRDFPDAPVKLTSETATIPLLDARSTALLVFVAENEAYWVENRRERYNLARRNDCIQTLY
jgi:hypothetical protein